MAGAANSVTKARKAEESGANVRRLLVCAANKGGVGKSMIVRAFIDLTRRMGRTVSGWDLDKYNGSLSRLYTPKGDSIADSIQGIGLNDITDQSARGWVDAIYSDAQDVVLDIPGGRMKEFVTALSGIPSDTEDEQELTRSAELVARFVADAGREFVLVSPIGRKKDSLVGFRDAAKYFGKSVHHVVVKNGFFGSVDQFEIFDGDNSEGERRFGAMGDLARSLEAEILYVERLNSFADAVADYYDLSFAAATEARARIGRAALYTSYWLDGVEKAFRGSWLDVRGFVGAVSEQK